jgi:hypothetical protein
MITKQKMWDEAALEKIENVFSKSYVSKLSSVNGSIVNMMHAFDYCLNKTAGLQVVNEESLTCRNGWNLWMYLSAEAVSLLKMLNNPVSETEVLNVLVSKQKDYGPNNIARFGTAGILIRIHDKLARFKNLLSKSNNDFNTAVSINSVQDETIVDTLIDIIGYSIVAMMWEKIDLTSGAPEFLLPLE